MRILVLGGDGFCGWPTALHLSDRGHDVTVVDNLSRRAIDLELEVESLTPIRPLGERLRVWQQVSGREIGFVRLDLATEGDRLTALLPGLRPDAIVHFAEQRAAPYSMRSTASKRYTVDNNVRATHNLLSALVATGTDAALVHLGTMGVYGYGWSGSAPIPEGYLTVKVPTPEGDLEREILHPANPGSVYHLTKTLDQLMFSFYAANDQVRITDLHQGIVWGTQTEQTARDERLINRFDYDGDYGTVLNRFLMQAAIDHPLTVHGTGGQTRAFIHIQDTVRCIEIALANPPAAGDKPMVFNQVTESHRVRDLAQLVGKLTGVPVANLPNPRMEAKENDLVVRNDRFLALGLAPTTLSDGLLDECTNIARRYRHRVDPSKIIARSVWRRGMETAPDLLTELPAAPPGGPATGGSGMQHRPSGARASAGRPQDPYGLPLTTTPEAADAYNQGLRRFLGVRSGAADEIRRSVATDPDFALGHAALALLGHAGAAEVDIPDALGAAVRAAVHRRPDERERSFLVAVAEQIGGPVDGPVGGRVNGCSRAAAPQLLRHIRDFPRDALCVNIAVPTISSNGVTQGEQAWSLIESLDLVYGEDPWYLGQLAFVRQEQSRWQEAETLACRALDADPGAGHAVHARAHVLYETGEHLAGLDWLEGWLGRHGADAFQSAHFSWHAALYELMLDDLRAVRDRYRTQLAPPQVTGARALIDSGSLLWRCHVTDRWEGRLPAAAVVDTTPEGWLDRPPTAFAALHAALLLAASADGDGLSRLRRSCLAHAEPDVSPTLAGLCQALMAVVEHRWDRAARLLQPLLPRLEPLGGSAAQRDVVEETLLYALVRAGRNRQAARLLSARLDRRPAPLDRNRLDVLMQREVVRD